MRHESYIVYEREVKLTHAAISNARPKILYIDIGSLLLSTSYLNQHPEMRTVIESSPSLSIEEFFKRIELDPKGVNRLNNFSHQYNILLFPFDSVFKREFLVAQGFDSMCLASEQAVNLRLDDNDKVRRMLSHVYKSNADWCVVGDLYLSEIEQSSKLFSGRYIKADNVNGVTEKLIESIKASFDALIANH